MKSRYYLSETEREVMESVWEQGKGVKQSALLELFHERGRDWKRQTLNTFLSRLEEKGLIKREHRIVEANCTEKEFERGQMREVIDNLYDGKIANLVMAFADGISEEEADSLLEIIQKRKETFKEAEKGE